MTRLFHFSLLQVLKISEILVKSQNDFYFSFPKFSHILKIDVRQIARSLMTQLIRYNFVVNFDVLVIAVNDSGINKTRNRSDPKVNSVGKNFEMIFCAFHRVSFYGRCKAWEFFSFNKFIKCSLCKQFLKHYSTIKRSKILNVVWILFSQAIVGRSFTYN